MLIKLIKVHDKPNLDVAKLDLQGVQFKSRLFQPYATQHILLNFMPKIEIPTHDKCPFCLLSRKNYLF